MYFLTENIIKRQNSTLTCGPGGPAGPTSPSFPGGPYEKVKVEGKMMNVKILVELGHKKIAAIYVTELPCYIYSFAMLLCS